MKSRNCFTSAKFRAVGTGIKTFLDTTDFYFALRFGNISGSILVTNFAPFATIVLQFWTGATIGTATTYFFFAHIFFT
jgi:hypothetical protein